MSNIEKRNSQRKTIQKEENEHFLDSPCNSILATQTLYTQNKTPDQLLDEALTHINEKQKNFT